MSTTSRATIAFALDHFEKSKIGAEITLRPQNQSESCGSIIRTKDRTDPQEFQTGSALSRNAGIAPSRKRHFAPLLDALHDSRRLQAASVLHQYRHLIAGDYVCEAQDKITKRWIPSGGQLDMASGDYPRVRRSAKSMSFKTWILITTVVAFGTLHVVGGIILFNASSSQPTETSLIAFRGD
jgi:hypothetical protein